MPIINKIKILGHGGYNKYKLCSSISDLKIVNQSFVNDFYNDIKSLMNGRKYCVGFDENSIIVYSDDLNDGEHETIASIIGSRLKSNINVIVSSYQDLIDLLRSRLTTLLGEGNFELISDNDSQKITIALASTVEHLREQIDSLIERVVPQNLEFEYDNGLPIDFEQVEYLESTGSQYIPFPELQTGEDFGIDYTFLNTSGQNWALNLQTGSEVHYRIDTRSFDKGTVGVHWGEYSNNKWMKVGEGSELCRVVANYKNDKRLVVVECLQTYEYALKTPNTVKNGFYLFAMTEYTAEGVMYKGQNVRIKIKHFAASKGQADVVYLVPALDPTGAPCMFDLVTRQPFYNSGTGDFIYPTDAAPAVSADLDEKFYAELTEHGVRRLYHVPHGYIGNKDKYATENGYKELVEPPMPLEGQWTPEWRETETQLILEWVEAETINTEEHE